MLKNKNEFLFKSVGICVALFATTSLAIAGDVSGGTKALPEDEYQAALLKADGKYPDVGLRKKLNDDCYCSGAYFGVTGGYAFGGAGALSKGTPNIANPGIVNQLIPTYNMAGRQYTGSVSAGYKFSNFRVEMSGEYRRHSSTNTSANLGGGAYVVNSRTQQYGALMSAFYDVEIPGIPVIPYVGAGVGLALSSTKYDVNYTQGGTTTNGNINMSRGSSFMGAAMAGVAVNITNNITLDVGYRFMNIGGGTATYDGATNAANVNTAAGVNLINVAGMGTAVDPVTALTTTETLVYPDFTSHEVRAGIRYRF